MKYIILSVNENQEYLFYTPLTCWAWRRIGWEPILFYHRENESDSLTPVEELVAKHSSVPTFFLKSIKGYRSDTITQVSRLYAQCLNIDALNYGDDYIMIGDIDLIPLSDYWQPDPNKITVYGHDLTGFTHYPMCYIGMRRDKWNEIMGTSWPGDYNAFIQRDLDAIPDAKNEDFYKRWFTDQDLITKRLEGHKDKIQFINRGQYSNGYAKGRIDRGAWNVNLDQFIDCHEHRDLFKYFYTKELPQEQRDLYVNKWHDHMDLLNKVWPDEDWSWFMKFTEQYAKLVQ